MHTHTPHPPAAFPPAALAQPHVAPSAATHPRAGPRPATAEETRASCSRSGSRCTTPMGVTFDSRAAWTTVFCVDLPPWNATTQLSAAERKLQQRDRRGYNAAVRAYAD